MVSWQVIPEERLTLYSPVGLLLRDDFSGTAPAGRVRARLDVRDAALVWHETEVAEIRTPREIVTYPGLGRSAHAATQPVFRYRVRIEADFYRPDYLMNLDGVEFDVHPYDDQAPPAVVPATPQTVVLLPGPTYPFARHVRVVRGVVQDAAATPVANVEVTAGPQERTLTDERGQFALPLRWPALVAVVQVDALDHRTGQSGTINVTLPADLGSGRTITIT